MAAVKPVLQALILADHIYQDAGSGKRIIAGTFNRLRVDTVPCHFGVVTWAYICLTEVRGEIQLELRYVDLKDHKVLLHLEGLKVKHDNPLGNVEVVLPIPGFPVPHEGVYAFEVHWAGEMLGFLRIEVSTAPGGGG